MEFVKIDGVSFNKVLVSNMTEKQFMEHEMHDNHYTHMDADKKQKLLKTAYKTITGKKAADPNGRTN